MGEDRKMGFRRKSIWMDRVNDKDRGGVIQINSKQENEGRAKE